MHVSSARASQPSTAGGLPPIKGFQKACLIEWEGKLSSAVFLPGCNFRCPFCHASALVAHGSDLESIPLEQVIDHLEANRGWLDGVVVTGGEATIHPALGALLVALREHAPAIKLDTNGSRPDVVRELIDGGLVDFVAMDVKAPLGEAYARAAGVEVDCRAIRSTIDLLRSSGIGREFRTTVVPGLHTSREIVAIARELGPEESLILQQFAPLQCLDPAFLERRPYTRERLREMAAAAGEFLAECRVRGEAAPGGAAR